MRGEEVVRYPTCEGCDIRGGGASPDALDQKLIIRTGDT